MGLGGGYWGDGSSWECRIHYATPSGKNDITLHLARTYGYVEWENEDGCLHGSPSRIFADGSIEYHQDDVFSRADGPACVYSDGTELYYNQHGEFIKVIHGGKYCCIGIDDPCDAYLKFIGHRL
jgi:hypothetical protein